MRRLIPISKYKKLAQKEYNIRYDCVRTVINWESCKSLKFDHICKWYLLKLDYAQENETH